MIDHKSKLPLHVQVEEYLRKLIESAKAKSGGFLPKEVELSNRLGVSRNTIRQATNKLENEGFERDTSVTEPVEPTLSTVNT